jgi:hypothetical protein
MNIWAAWIGQRPVSISSTEPVASLNDNQLASIRTTKSDRFSPSICWHVSPLWRMWSALRYAGLKRWKA